jgi:hypothetical protein
LQAFALSFIAYWLIKAIPPFWLAIIATLLTYTLGPILTRQFSDPNVPSMKPVIDQKVQNIKHGAEDAASSAIDHAANTTQNLSSQALDTASSTTDHTRAAAQDLKNRTSDTATYTADRAAEMGQTLKNRSMDTADPATDGMGEIGHGLGAQHVGDYGTAAPNAPSFNHNGSSKDRGTQLHLLESENVNTAL